MRSVIDVGANVTNGATGQILTPAISISTESRSFHREIMFFFDRVATVELYKQLCAGYWSTRILPG